MRVALLFRYAVLACVWFLSWTVARAQQSPTARIHPDLAKRAEQVAGGERIPVFVVFAYQPQSALLAAEAMRATTAPSGTQALPSQVDRARAAMEREIRPAQQRLLDQLTAGGAGQTGVYTAINMVTAEVPASLLPSLAANPEVALVFLAQTRSAASLPLSVAAMGTPAYWTATGRTGEGASVALVDTGVRADHPAFSGRTITDRVFLGFGSLHPCFDDDATNGRDRQGHGTHIAGILMGQGSTGFVDYYGVARGLSSLYNVKTAYRVKAPCNTSSNGELDDRDLIAALEWAAFNTPSRIISLSFGGAPNGDGDDPFTKTVDFISDIYDSFIAVAAGNTGPGISTITTPAIGYNVTAVANWNFREGPVISNTSSRGPTIGSRFKPDLAAPGVDITSANVNWDTTPGTSDDYTTKSGTSMAAPHVAGAAALLASAGVTDPLQIKAILINSAGESNWAVDRGWGFVNLAAAMPQPSFRDSVLLQAGGHQLYRVGSSSGTGAFAATVTWNRHLDGAAFTPRFNNLDLYAYSLATGTQLAVSASTIQNVEKIRLAGTAAPSADDLVVKVDTAAPNPSIEFYGIAMSRAFARASGPLLVASCQPPVGAFAGIPFAVPCTISNRGDLPAFQVVASGVQAGTIPAGASVTVSPQFTGTSTGTGVFSANFDSRSFGEAFSTSVNFTVTLSAPPPAPGVTTLAAPADGSTGVAISGSPLTWTPTAGATSYDVYFGPTTPPPFLANTSSASIATPAAAPLSGSVRYFWRVIARNAGGPGPASPIWSFTTAASSGLYFVPRAAPCTLVTATLEAGEAAEFRLAGSPCFSTAPAAPAAYSVVVSVAPAGDEGAPGPGYLTIWPADQTQPLTAVLTSSQSNAAILSGDSIRVYSPDRAKLAIEVNGSFTANASGGLVYYPLSTLCRASSASCPAIPVGAARAFAVNQDGANGGRFAIVPGDSPPADAVVFGYFAPAGSPGGLTYRPAANPCRVVDTRLAEGGGPISAQTIRDLAAPASGACGDAIPRGAVAVLNATMVSDSGSVTLWTKGQPRPAFATVFISDEDASANAGGAAVVRSNAAMTPWPLSAAATSVNGTHLILDLYGLFLP